MAFSLLIPAIQLRMIAATLIVSAQSNENGSAVYAISANVVLQTINFLF
jgi:hypothetical protein